MPDEQTQIESDAIDTDVSPAQRAFSAVVASVLVDEWFRGLRMAPNRSVGKTSSSNVAGQPSTA